MIIAVKTIRCYREHTEGIIIIIWDDGTTECIEARKSCSYRERGNKCPYAGRNDEVS